MRSRIEVKDDDKLVVPVAVAAAMLDTPEENVRAWIACGKLPAWRTGIKGWKILKSDLEPFVRQQIQLQKGE